MRTQGLPKRIGSYRVRGLLGTGAQGQVFAGVSEKEGREVALKVFQPKGQPSEEGPKARFHREAKVLQGLASRATPRFLELLPLAPEEPEGAWVLVMERVQGRPLQEILDREELSIEAAAKLFRELFEVLSEVHQEGLLHRDLKPSNILLRHSDDSPVLVDWGLAKPVREEVTRLTETGVLVGTPQYFAPEQLRGEPPSERSEVYALTTVFYQALLGQLPFGPIRNLQDLIRRTREEIPEIDPERLPTPALREILHQGLRQDPAERPLAGEIASRLSQYLTAAPAPEETEVLSNRRTRWSHPARPRSERKESPPAPAALPTSPPKAKPLAPSPGGSRRLGGILFLAGLTAFFLWTQVLAPDPLQIGDLRLVASPKSLELEVRAKNAQALRVGDESFQSQDPGKVWRTWRGSLTLETLEDLSQLSIRAIGAREEVLEPLEIRPEVLATLWTQPTQLPLEGLVEAGARSPIPFPPGVKFRWPSWISSSADLEAPVGPEFFQAQELPSARTSTDSDPRRWLVIFSPAATAVPLFELEFPEVLDRTFSFEPTRAQRPLAVLGLPPAWGEARLRIRSLLDTRAHLGGAWRIRPGKGFGALEAEIYAFRWQLTQLAAELEGAMQADGSPEVSVSAIFGVGRKQRFAYAHRSGWAARDRFDLARKTLARRAETLARRLREVTPEPGQVLDWLWHCWTLRRGILVLESLLADEYDFSPPEIFREFFRAQRQCSYGFTGINDDSPEVDALRQSLEALAEKVPRGDRPGLEFLFHRVFFEGWARAYVPHLANLEKFGNLITALEAWPPRSHALPYGGHPRLYRELFLILMLTQNSMGKEIAFDSRGLALATRIQRGLEKLPETPSKSLEQKVLRAAWRHLGIAAPK